jgi:SAM-dependent methyltransferase
MSEHQAVDVYDAKPTYYFTGARDDYVKLMPHAPTAALLEIGCGAGATGAAALAAGKCGRYVGFELTAEAAAKALAVSKEIIVGDIETLDLDFPDATFDTLIMSEVLEHLAWPDKVLAKIGPKLKPGAQIFASSPNIAHWKVARELMKGRFDPTDFGVMDRTHLRWFTPTTYAAMFTAAGYMVEYVGPIRELRGRKKIFATVTGRPHLFWVQISLRARWKP